MKSVKRLGRIIPKRKRRTMSKSRSIISPPPSTPSSGRSDRFQLSPRPSSPSSRRSNISARSPRPSSSSSSDSPFPSWIQMANPGTEGGFFASPESSYSSEQDRAAVPIKVDGKTIQYFRHGPRAQVDLCAMEVWVPGNKGEIDTFLKLMDMNGSMPGGLSRRHPRRDLLDVNPSTRTCACPDTTLTEA